MEAKLSTLTWQQMAKREHMTKCAKVCERAEAELSLGPGYERINLIMDLESLADLNVDRLLAAPAFDFGHDIYGIMRHMDRSNYPGRLTGCFGPRCGRISAKAEAGHD